MSATTLNRLLRRRRQHLAVLVVLVWLAGAVVAHHTATGQMDIGTMAMGGVMVVCLAVLPAVAAAATAAGAALLPRAPLFFLAWLPARLVPAAPLPRARSSPVATVVLRR